MRVANSALMTRSFLPGLLIALGVLALGLDRRLHGRALSGQPRRARSTCCGRAAHRPAERRSAGGRERGAAGARAARGRGRAGRRGARGRRHRVPGPVPQSAGLARHPRRLVGRGARRRDRHLLLARRDRDREPRLRRRAGRGRRGLSDRLAAAVARSDPGAGAHRRGGRRAARRRRRPREISRRSLQPASGHDVLAARQPRRHHRLRSAAADRPGGARHRRADRVALAAERDVAAGGRGARARHRRPGRCASRSSPPRRW